MGLWKVACIRQLEIQKPKHLKSKIALLFFKESEQPSNHTKINFSKPINTKWKAKNDEQIATHSQANHELNRNKETLVAQGLVWLVGAFALHIIGTVAVRSGREEEIFCEFSSIDVDGLPLTGVYPWPSDKKRKERNSSTSQSHGFKSCKRIEQPSNQKRHIN